MSRGKLITLEGIDGSGKSSVAKLLASDPMFSNCVFTREPTESWIGQAVTRALGSDTDDLAELMLFTADHAEHISKFIIPAMESGRHVISDRYSASRYAYQGVTLKGRFEDPMSWIHGIHKDWTIIPDLAILFDIDPRIAVERCGSRGSKTKFEKVTFLEEVRNNYLRLAKENSYITVIDANRALEEVLFEVAGLISAHI